MAVWIYRLVWWACPEKKNHNWYSDKANVIAFVLMFRWLFISSLSKLVTTSKKVRYERNTRNSWIIFNTIVSEVCMYVFWIAQSSSSEGNFPLCQCLCCTISNLYPEAKVTKWSSIQYIVAGVILFQLGLSRSTWKSRNYHPMSVRPFYPSPQGTTSFSHNISY